jgi:hypothetical protein
MGGKNIPTITQWLKFPWEKSESDMPSDDDVNEIREAIKREEKAKEKQE